MDKVFNNKDIMNLIFKFRGPNLNIKKKYDKVMEELKMNFYITMKEIEKYIYLLKYDYYIPIIEFGYEADDESM